jgi:DNA-3-methyladenine glycosylase
MKLPRGFYARPVLVVARECVGKLLVHRTPEGEAAGRIVEAEAYRGPLDLAAHSARGLRTKRTAVIIVASEGEPHGVLIRALEPVRGLELMVRRRGGTKSPGGRELTNGPGKLTQALGITGEDYGRDLCGDRLFLEEADRPAGRVGRSARINVDYAGAWAAKRWRFYDRGNRYVSVRPRD